MKVYFFPKGSFQWLAFLFLRMYYFILHTSCEKGENGSILRREHPETNSHIVYVVLCNKEQSDLHCIKEELMRRARIPYLSHCSYRGGKAKTHPQLIHRLTTVSQKWSSSVLGEIYWKRNRTFVVIEKMVSSTLHHFRHGCYHNLSRYADAFWLT